MEGVALMCCPEDQLYQRICKVTQKLCYDCQIPICASCRYCLTQNVCSPMALLTDNFIGYIDPWIYEADITWMERTVATLSGRGRRSSPSTAKQHIGGRSITSSTRSMRAEDACFSEGNLLVLPWIGSVSSSSWKKPEETLR